MRLKPNPKTRPGAQPGQAGGLINRLSAPTATSSASSSLTKTEQAKRGFLAVANSLKSASDKTAWLRKIPLTALGWTLIGLFPGCLIGAIWWGWEEASAAAFLAVILLFAAALQTLGGNQLDLQITVNKNRLRRGAQLHCGLQVKNRGRTHSRASLVEVPVGNQVLSFRVPGLGAGESWEKDFGFPTLKRELIEIGPADAIKRDVLQLIHRQAGWPDIKKVYVHPNYVFLPGALTGFIRDIEGETTNVISDADVAFHALRPYVAGDDRRHIHWKMSAHSGELMMRQYQETRRSHHLLVVDLNQAAYADLDFELAIETVASLAVSSIRSGQPVSLVSSQTYLDNPSSRQVLDYLTTVQPQAADQSLQELFTWANAHVSQTSVCSVVTGPDTAIEQLSKIALSAPHGILVNGFRADNGTTWRRKQVGAHQVITLGSLAQLLRIRTAKEGS